MHSLPGPDARQWVGRNSIGRKAKVIGYKPSPILLIKERFFMFDTRRDAISRFPLPQGFSISPPVSTEPDSYSNSLSVLKAPHYWTAEPDRGLRAGRTPFVSLSPTTIGLPSGLHPAL